MAGSMVSGIILSEHIFHFEKPFIVSDMARQVHMFCAYWGMILMSVHIGMHWRVIVVMCGRLFSENSILRQWISRLLAFGIAFFGAYAFQKRQIVNYLLMKNHFLFLNPTDTIGIFLFDYLAVMVCVIWISYYAGCLIKHKKKK